MNGYEAFDPRIAALAEGADERRQQPATKDEILGLWNRAEQVTSWPEACQSMFDKRGWGEVDCATRERFFADYGDRLTVFSTLTDPDGHYGAAVVYTEWGVKGGEKPWLRDYRWPGEGCQHFMPTANIAWPTASAEAHAHG